LKCANIDQAELPPFSLVNGSTALAEFALPSKDRKLGRCPAEQESQLQECLDDEVY
jgi:hypothetical protein